MEVRYKYDRRMINVRWRADASKMKVDYNDAISTLRLAKIQVR